MLAKCKEKVNYEIAGIRAQRMLTGCYIWLQKIRIIVMRDYNT